MNPNLFKTGTTAPAADTTNNAGGVAYSLSSHAALANMAATGTMADGYYTSAEVQLDELLAILPRCNPDFILKTALYSRQLGFMKDLPAILLAWLFVQSKASPRPVATNLEHWASVILDNAKMVRNFMQVLRSGRLPLPSGKANRSPGARASRVVERWLNSAPIAALINGSVGNTPSLSDVIKMVHPKPADGEREGTFAWIIGKWHKPEKYPALLRQLLQFRQTGNNPPALDFRLLVSENTSKETWRHIAENSGWHATRMNLNTFTRHGVLNGDTLSKVCSKLSDPDLIAKAKVFPYQLMTAYINVGAEVPGAAAEALQDAMELAISNVPSYDCQVVVCPDVSGSMSSPVTGRRGSATTKVRCIDVAALVAAAVLRQNKEARVLPFEYSVRDVRLNPRDSVMTNARKLAAIGGGGTCCSAPLALLNKEAAKADLVIYVSDNESWADINRMGSSGTSMAQEWVAFKRRNPNAKLVCVDIRPSSTTQVRPDKDVLLVGGFSDVVFDVIRLFLSGEYGKDAWVAMIDKIPL